MGHSSKEEAHKAKPQPHRQRTAASLLAGATGPSCSVLLCSGAQEGTEGWGPQHQQREGSTALSILHQPQKQRGNLQFVFCWPDGTKCPLGLGGRLPAGSSQNWAHVLQGQQLQRGHKRNHGRHPPRTQGTALWHSASSDSASNEQVFTWTPPLN